jgi:hypothetical protein
MMAVSACCLHAAAVIFALAAVSASRKTVTLMTLFKTSHTLLARHTIMLQAW